MVTDTLRWFFLIFSFAVVMSACENETEEEYVKTRKGDIVRSRDAEAANIPIQSSPQHEDSEGEEGGGE
ncbi:MAG: hypothetical protein RLZZ09_3401 [Pseudomonadota bacterium]|jgi:hypothetical protein